MDEPHLVDTVVVSTPGPDLAATLDALGDLDTDVARAVASAVVERLRALIAAPLLPRVAEEIARALAPPRSPRPGTRRATRTVGRTARPRRACSTPTPRAGGSVRACACPTAVPRRGSVQSWEEWLAGNEPAADRMSDPAPVERAHPGVGRDWQRALFDAGWLVPRWPAELGGREASAVEQMIYLEELSRRRLPRTVNPQGLDVCAPTLIDLGDDRQRDDGCRRRCTARRRGAWRSTPSRPRAVSRPR